MERSIYPRNCSIIISRGMQQLHVSKGMQHISKVIQQPLRYRAPAYSRAVVSRKQRMRKGVLECGAFKLYGSSWVDLSVRYVNRFGVQ